ncbi:MAG TPA: SDR family oxidoreductase [Anaerolineales bacterium]|nr:SDR family oxidoreductase [Anaerolineales bacterium]
MKVLILGGSGMLGHQLCRVLSERMEVWATFRENPDRYTGYKLLPEERAIPNVSVLDLARLNEVLDTVEPDALVNAVGIVKQRDEAKQAIASIQINALFPHQLADLCAPRGIRVIQISTDCVFSGLRGNYTEIDVPDPVDLYGRTKLLGELNRPGCLTLRTSIIGWQLNTFSSLLSWFALQRNKRIKGYHKAIYSGFSTNVMAQLIGDILLTRPDLSGLYQIASEPISKFDLLVKLRDILGWKDIAIDSDDQFFCDRSLSGAHFSIATGWRPPTWEAMLQGLAIEWPHYADVYAQR